MDLVRTPESRFDELPGFPYAPRYADLPDGLRMHYVDEGPASAETVLLLHGQPTWSYLYRTMIERLSAQGVRAVAPDLVGFGRSDKPRERTAHSVHGHVDWMAQFVDAVAAARRDRSSCRTGAARSASACSASGPGWCAASWRRTPRCTRPTPRWRAGWPGPSTPMTAAPSRSRSRCSTTSA